MQLSNLTNRQKRKKNSKFIVQIIRNNPFLLPLDKY